MVIGVDTVEVVSPDIITEVKQEREIYLDCMRETPRGAEIDASVQALEQTFPHQLRDIFINIDDRVGILISSIAAAGYYSVLRFASERMRADFELVYTEHDLTPTRWFPDAKSDPVVNGEVLAKAGVLSNLARYSSLL